MTDPTPDQYQRLVAFHKDAHAAEARANQARAMARMAQETLAGAEAELLSKLARFKGAAEFVFGSTEIGFDYDEKSGRLTFRPASVPPPHGLGKRKKR